jgi:uncharacterized protein with PIN domain
MQPLRFSAGPELARLARHLRLVGFDTTWKEDRGTGELLEEARSEGRILLSRDAGVCERAQAGLAHQVVSEDRDAELVEVLDRFGLRDRVRSGKGFFTICLQCNGPLLPVKGHQISDRIPGEVLLGHTDFFFCSRCEKVYPKGDFHARMRGWALGLVAN